jgi:predicted transposase YdaD
VIITYRDAESVFNSAKKSGESLGHAKGLAEGERKKALEIAKAFKEMGLPIADIAKGVYSNLVSSSVLSPLASIV